MKNVFLAICAMLFGLNGFAQEKFKVDTVYYNSNSKRAIHPAFASYYRIAITFDDSASVNIYRDFDMMDGALLAEGEFIYIDKEDDSKTIFEGENVIYDAQSKSVSKIMNFKGGS